MICFVRYSKFLLVIQRFSCTCKDLNIYWYWYCIYWVCIGIWSNYTMKFINTNMNTYIILILFHCLIRGFVFHLISTQTWKLLGFQGQGASLQTRHQPAPIVGPDLGESETRCQHWSTLADPWTAGCQRTWTHRWNFSPGPQGGATLKRNQRRTPKGKKVSANQFKRTGRESWSLSCGSESLKLKPAKVNFLSSHMSRSSRVMRDFAYATPSLLSSVWTER